MTIKKNRTMLTLVLWQLVYKLLLDAVYVFWISPIYAYQGFVYSYSGVCFVFSTVAVLLMAYPNGKLLARGNASDLIIAIIGLIYFFPQATLCAFAQNNLEYFAFAMTYYALLLALNKVINFKGLSIRIRERVNFFEGAIVILGLLMIGISAVYAGFRISFDLSDYYGYRFEARAYGMPAILRYPFNWAKLFIPIGLTYALTNKKKVLAFFAAFAQVLCFSFDGKKSALFLFFLAFAIAFFYKPKRNLQIPVLLSGMSALVVVEMIVRTGQSFIAKYVIRRVFFDPPYIGWAYFDFFSRNEFDYLRSSVFRRFGMPSPYGDGIPRLIGLHYYGNAANNANTGLCGDAFSNFGWASLLIFPLLIVLLIKILGVCMEGVEPRIHAIVCIAVAYTILNGAFFTMLLTNGLAALCLLMLLCPKEQGMQPSLDGQRAWPLRFSGDHSVSKNTWR